MTADAAHGTDTPRILLVEDDPVTSAFLVAALHALPARVDATDSLAAASRCARQHTHAVWLIDANLPDGSGSALLAQLRADGLRATPAIAHTATEDPAALQSLLDAGFMDALAKPMTAAVLHAAIARALQAPSGKTAGDSAGSHQSDACNDNGNDSARPSVHNAATNAPHLHGPACDETHGGHPVWDDLVALQALAGERGHVDALRALFIGELPAVRNSVADAVTRGDNAAVRATLHRLRASCSFVGASRLGSAAAALHAAPDCPQTLAQFTRACDAVFTDPVAQALTLR